MKERKTIIGIVVIGIFAVAIATCLIVASFGKNKSKDAADTISDLTPEGSKEVEADALSKASNIGIHDPSIFQDPQTGVYYSYGSHIVAGKSEDLVSWTYICSSSSSYGTGNKLFSKHYLEEFKEVYDWLGSDVKEGIWAIDLKYSEAAKNAGNDPYLMYVTVVNGSYKSAICLATSDSPEGPFSYKGMLVTSDYSVNDVDKTNFLEVLGVKSVDELTTEYKNYYFKPSTSSQTSSEWYKKNLPDAIDPAPFYDGNGDLYLTYGSFTCAGGLRVIKLDATTGLRSKENYEFKAGEQDPYFGKKIANNYGEGPYILTVKNEQSTTGYYYFMFYSQGNLRAAGGYNMRMFRSEYPDKGYVDYAGNSAITTSKSRTELGVRIMDNFKFSYMGYASASNGGNSAIVNTEGKILVHYHSKKNDGTEGFVIKSNQMFMSADGWLCTAPYKYSGEELKVIAQADVVGDYEFIYHRLEYFKDPTNNADAYVSSVSISLNADGTISGAYNGTWSLKDSAITIKISDREYKGVVVEQYDEQNTRTKTITFTALGKDNRAIWGSRYVKSDEECVEEDAKAIKVETAYDEAFDLETVTTFGSTITWSCDKTDIVKLVNGKATITYPEKDTQIKLTAQIKKNSVVKVVDFTATIMAKKAITTTETVVSKMTATYQNKVIGQYSFEDKNNLGYNWKTKTVDLSLNNVTQVAAGYKGNAIAFNGTDSFVSFSTTITSQIKDGFTFTCMLYVDDLSKDMPIMNVSSDTNACDLKLLAQKKVSTKATTEVTMSINGEATGKWHHIAVRYASNGTSLLKVDGHEVTGSSSESRGTVGGLEQTLKKAVMVLGKGSDNSFLKGYIDEVYLFSGVVDTATMGVTAD